MKTERFYIPSLEGLRFVAFLLVFVHHMPRAKFFLPLAKLADQGWVGVDIFFALSAFLLYSLLVIEWNRTAQIEFGRFMLRRALRIVPLLYVFTFLVVALYAFQSSHIDFARTAGIVAFFDNVMCWFYGFSPIPYTAHLWTLSYEMQFYPLIPLLAIVGTRNQKCLGIIIGSVLILALFARGISAILQIPHPTIWVTPFLRPESMVAGIILAIMAAKGALKRLNSFNIIGPALLLLCIFFLFPMPLAGFGSLWTYIIVGALSAAALVLALENNLVKTVLAFPPIAFLGKISFGLYVFHVFAIGVVEELLVRKMLLHPSTNSIDYLLFGFSALTLTIVLSVVSWFAYERRLLRLKEFIERVPSRPI